MNELHIFLPSAVLALFTLLILLLIPIRAFRAHFDRQLVIEQDLKFGVPAAGPVHINLLNRNYMNLLESPLLFYVASVVVFVIHKADGVFLGLLWAYMALRIVHSLVHLTYNHVLHRGLIFGVGAGVLTIIWVRILLALW